MAVNRVGDNVVSIFNRIVVLNDFYIDLWRKTINNWIFEMIDR